MLLLDFLDGVETGTEPAPVVDIWVVAVEEGVGSRALRLGAILIVRNRIALSKRIGEEFVDGCWSWTLVLVTFVDREDTTA